MVITPFLHDSVFQPEQLAVMSEALESVCRDLGLSDRTDPLTELVAEHIIDAAQRGMTSKTALYLSAMLEFKSTPH